MDKWTAAGFISVYIAIRVVDAVLPGGRRFRLLDRWTVKDTPEKETGE